MQAADKSLYDLEAKAQILQRNLDIELSKDSSQKDELANEVRSCDVC